MLANSVFGHRWALASKGIEAFIKKTRSSHLSGFPLPHQPLQPGHCCPGMAASPPC